MNKPTLAFAAGLLLTVGSFMAYDSFQPNPVCSASQDAKDALVEQRKTIDELMGMVKKKLGRSCPVLPKAAVEHSEHSEHLEHKEKPKGVADGPRPSVNALRQGSGTGNLSLAFVFTKAYFDSSGAVIVDKHKPMCDWTPDYFGYYPCYFPNGYSFPAQSPPTVAPIPSTLWLLASTVGLLGLIRRWL